MMNDETTESNDEEDKDQLMSMPEVAEKYGFNPKHLAQLSSNGRLKAKKIGGIWINTLGYAQEYLRSSKTTGSYKDDIEWVGSKVDSVGEIKKQKLKKQKT